MTPSPSIARRRGLRRPARASRLAAVALLGVVGAIGLPQTALAQELDPETLAAELEATVDQSAMEATIDQAIDRAIESGGAVAPPTPTATAPTSAPEPVAAPEPTPPTPSETAPAPAPESGVAAPRNINIDIRVLSPGDNGDVNQVIEDIGGGAAPGHSEVVPGDGDGPELTMNWVWKWSESCEDDMRAASAAVEWNWTWEACGAAVPDEDMLRALMPEVPDDLIPAPEPAGDVAGAEEDFVATLDGPSGGPGDHGESQPRRDDATPLLSGIAPSSLLTTADAEGGPARPVGSDRVRAAHGRRQQSAVRQRAPEQAPPALPSAAASGLSGGGSFAPLGAVLLALLCLMAPRALGLARFPDRRLTSQLSSSRLERPG
jgi:hypothetical protein